MGTGCPPNLVASAPGITAWRVAYQGWSSEHVEPVAAQAAIRAGPPFRPVRAGETPPCLHTTSRCLALGVVGGGGWEGSHGRTIVWPKRRTVFAIRPA